MKNLVSVISTEDSFVYVPHRNWLFMEGSAKNLVLSRRLTLVILIGFIGIFASPFTQQYGPMYPIYSVQVFQEDLVLNDDFPVLEIVYPFGDKIVIEELTTNGSPVTIHMYNGYFSEVPTATVHNITEIQGIFLVGAGSEPLGIPVIRISQYSNQSTQISITIRTWGTYPSTDYIVMGPSYFLFLAVPLAYFMYRYRGHKLKKSGYPLLFLIILSAALITPYLVYTYNGGATILRHDEIQETHTFSFMLNASNPHQEFHESIVTVGTSSFFRIARIDTNGTPVSITVDSDEYSQSLHLSNITAISSSGIQIELPRENITGFTLQFDWIGQNANISLSIENVNDVWAPEIDPVPYCLSGIVGLAVSVITLAIPRNRESQLPDNTS
ncbi:MAG: hypothetical protein ACW98U_08945 [Candidatus Thorarchaeota archaeon]